MLAVRNDLSVAEHVLNLASITQISSRKVYLSGFYSILAIFNAKNAVRMAILFPAENIIYKAKNLCMKEIPLWPVAYASCEAGKQDYQPELTDYRRRHGRGRPIAKQLTVKEILDGVGHLRPRLVSSRVTPSGC